MVIFHSYVSLPEGTRCKWIICPDMNRTHNITQSDCTDVAQKRTKQLQTDIYIYNRNNSSRPDISDCRNLRQNIFAVLQSVRKLSPPGLDVSYFTSFIEMIPSRRPPTSPRRRADARWVPEFVRCCQRGEVLAIIRNYFCSEAIHVTNQNQKWNILSLIYPLLTPIKWTSNHGVPRSNQALNICWSWQGILQAKAIAPTGWVFVS